MDKHTIKNFKILALPGAAFGVLLWIIIMALDPVVLYYTLVVALVLITVDELEKK